MNMVLLCVVLVLDKLRIIIGVILHWSVGLVGLVLGMCWFVRLWVGATDVVVLVCLRF